MRVREGIPWTLSAAAGMVAGPEWTGVAAGGREGSIRRQLTDGKLKR